MHLVFNANKVTLNKVEFQDRGAGHIHGTLWLNLKKLQQLVKDPQGELHPKLDVNDKTPSYFNGLEGAFRAFRSEKGRLSPTQLIAVQRFVDEFTTVCTHENTVGREVARIAKEVNQHHHTKLAASMIQHADSIIPNFHPHTQ